jgi:ABC-type nitrate/sulfonate/bicarbonate transport system substrate-binding protein
MTDDKTKVGEPDRSRVSGSQDYEIQYLADKHGLSAEQVKKLIVRVGNDREKIEAAARQLSKAG